MDSLPDEILTNAFLHLDHPSLLQARLTCRRFRDIIKARYFWLATVRRLKDEFDYTLPEEESSYTDEDLELWASLRLRIVDKLNDWPSGPLTPSLKIKCEFRIPPQPNSTLTKVEILAGGRWFTMCGADGTVCLYDMDAAGPGPTALFSQGPGFDVQTTDQQFRFITKCWVDKLQPRFTFFMAKTWCHNGTAENCISRAVFGGYTPKTTFVSETLTIFKYPLEGSQLVQIALNDQYFVAVAAEGDDPTRQTPKLHVVDYSLVSRDNASLRPTVVECPAEGLKYPVLEFITGDTFSLVTLNDIHVFQVMSSCSEKSGQNTGIQLLHHVSRKIPTHNLPPRRRFPEACRLGQYDRSSISAISFSSDSSQPPVVFICSEAKNIKQLDSLILQPHTMKAGGYPWSVTCALDPTSRIILKDSLKLVQHQWDYTTGQLQAKCISLPALPKSKTPFRRLVIFSQETGRLVLMRRDEKLSGTHVVSILDLVWSKSPSSILKRLQCLLESFQI